MSGLTRRRFVAISAAAAGSTLFSGAAAKQQSQTFHWKGVALGAEASLRIDGIEPAVGEAIAARCRDEIDRLEGLFSLYRSDSAIARLNQTGALDSSDPDILALMSMARAVHDATGGAFDPTVQPQWAALAERYAGSKTQDADFAALHSPAAGFVHVRVDAEQISFDQPGMAITLNGIAQGYVTDRIAALLRAEGLHHVLVHVGEFRAVGPRSDGAGWPIGIKAPGQAGGVARTIMLSDSALATSEPLGTTFDNAGTIGHILDPRSGEPALRRRSVSVEAPSAALADALSTAFCIMRDGEITAALDAFPGARLVHMA